MLDFLLVGLHILIMTATFADQVMNMNVTGMDIKNSFPPSLEPGGHPL